MKKLLPLIFIFFLPFCLLGQNKVPKVNEESIIIDELGNQYSYTQWRNILMRQEHYLQFRSRENDKDIFVIRKYTEEQKEKRMAAAPKPKSSPSFTEGDAFKYFNMRTLDGQKIKAKDLSGKVLVFNFWFINCPPCRAEIPELNRLVDRYKNDKDVMFLGVALDEKTDLEEFFKKNPFNYIQLRWGRDISSSQGVKSYPTHLVVDKEGKIQFSGQGLSVNTVYWIDKTIKEVL